MEGNVLQIHVDGRPASATEPTGTCLVLHGEVEHGSDGDVAQKDENMDETNYSEVENEESGGGSDYGTSRSCSSTSSANQNFQKRPGQQRLLLRNEQKWRLQV